jgi:hypothetical protein
MLANDLPSFHRWFLAAGAAPCPAILLHGFPDLQEGLGAAVARHLNEFDEDAAGNWSAFAPELIGEIAAHSAQRNLLGLADSCKNCPPSSPCGRRKIFAALAERGHAVVEGPLAVEACAPLSNIFRVSLGPAPFGGRSFHLVLAPELFCARSMPAIIGDTYLEWMAAREMADTV